MLPHLVWFANSANGRGHFISKPRKAREPILRVVFSLSHRCH